MPHLTSFMDENDIIYILKKMYERDEPERWNVIYRDDMKMSTDPYYNIILSLEECPIFNYEGLLEVYWIYDDSKKNFLNEVTITERTFRDGFMRRYGTDIIFYEYDNKEIMREVSENIITIKKLTDNVEYKNR